MTNDDVIFGFRLQLLDLAGRTNVTDACVVFGVHRSTYDRWLSAVEAHGLEMLRPRERRAPRMPNQLPQVICERILAFSIAHPGYGPDRISSELRRDRWGAIVVSPNGVWRVLCRHGLNRKAARFALVAGYAAAYEPPREPPREAHIQVQRPGELVGIDCFYVGRLRNVAHPVWQVTAIDCYSSYAWADLVSCPTGQPTSTNTSRLAQRVARGLAACGWQLERVLSDNGGEFKGAFDTALDTLGVAHTRIHPGRPQTNGHVERLHKTILDECWRPSFARYLYVSYGGLRRDLDAYLDHYNYDRAHNGRITQGRIPGDIIDPARKMRPR
jgi:transposase InsO family protein